jgi:hypothetical protein
LTPQIYTARGAGAMPASNREKTLSMAASPLSMNLVLHIVDVGTHREALLGKLNMMIMLKTMRMMTMIGFNRDFELDNDQYNKDNCREVWRES